jgi:hypothetical protein
LVGSGALVGAGALLDDDATGALLDDDDAGAGALVGVGVSAQDIKSIAVKINSPARMTRVLRFIFLLTENNRKIWLGV